MTKSPEVREDVIPDYVRTANARLGKKSEKMRIADFASLKTLSV